MGKDAFRTFRDVSELRKIGAKSLSMLLGMDAAFFSQNGIVLTDNDDDFPFTMLIDVLENQKQHISPRLVNALYLITEMADASAMDTLVELAKLEGVIDSGGKDDFTAADLAVKLYLHNPDLLERNRDMRVVERKRSYVFYSAHRPYPHEMFTIDRRMHKRFEVSCDDQFRDHQCGAGAKLKCFPDDDVVRFLVRHGETLKREGVIQNDESASIIYRPEMFDAFHFDTTNGTLGMPNGPKWKMELYRKSFGVILYNDANAFKPLPLFSLEPLCVQGESALSCAMLRTVDSIRLSALEWEREGGNGICSYKNVDNIFAALRDDGHAFPTNGILKARFVVKFAEKEDERFFEIQGAHKVHFQRDTDLELLWAWLDEKGFIVDPDECGLTENALQEEEVTDALA